MNKMEGKKVNLFWSATEAATCEATAAAVAASVLESRSLITKVMEMKWKEIFKDERKNVVRLYFIAARLLAGNDSSTISSTLVYDVSENDRVNDITKRLLSAKLS